MYTPAERNDLAQQWLRREYATDPNLPLMLTEVDELVQMPQADLETLREDYITDLEAAQQGRSDFFPNLATFEAWYRLAGYVLGAPLARYVPPKYTRERVVPGQRWARSYALQVEAYAPYAPLVVEEWTACFTLPPDIGDRIEQEIATRHPRVFDQAEWWKHLGYTPIGPRFWRERHEFSIPILTPQAQILVKKPGGVIEAISTWHED